MSRYDNYWPPYVSVAERRRRAAQKVARMKKAGQQVTPVEITGRKIATTFWGEAWCKNLESYSDYANRLPRGRSYVRNGSVIDLQIEAGQVRALVSGTDLYNVDIKIKPLPKTKWTQIKGQCSGQIDSLIELLQGAISKGVMEIVTRKGEGLFPSPREITLTCSCPDWATMCKHVAATLYGIGARLDQQPELLFTLRKADPAEMVEAAIDQPTGAGRTGKGRVLDSDQLSSVFGVDIDIGSLSADQPVTTTGRKRRVATTKKSATGNATRKKHTTKSATKKTKASKNKRTASKAAAKKTSTKKSLTRKGASKTSKKPASKKSKVRKKTARPSE